MPRVSPILTNFTAGEWSPQLYGRVDLAQYPNACRRMENFIPRVHGGAQKAPGTRFIAEIKNSASTARLFAFQYSTSQAYIIEAGDGYMRFYKDKGQILDGSAAYEINTLFSIDDIPLVRTCQDKDLMYLFHNDYHPQKLTRYGHADWEIINVPFTCGPFQPTNSATEVGSDLITNGDMEEDSGCTDVGTPIVQKRTSWRSYKNEYSRTFVSSAANDGFKMTAFTSETDKSYRMRARLYKTGGDIKVTVRKGDNSGNVLADSILDLPDDEWVEIERYYKETAGGAGAYVKFTNPDVVAFDDSIVLNSGFETASSWYKVPSDKDGSGRSTTQKHAGSYSWKLSPSFSNVRGVRSEPFVTETSRVYRLIFWLYSSSLTSLKVKVTSGDGVTVTTYTPGSLPASTWTQYTYDFEETVGGSAAFIQFEATTAHMGDIYIDDVTFKAHKAQYYIDSVEVYEVETVTITPSATTGSGITLTASSSLFTAGHIGAFFSITHGDDTGYVKVVSYTSATVVVADVLTDLGDTAATPLWREGSWSLKNGYPACGAFYEQRLMCANTPTDPDAVWGSRSTSYEDFTPGTTSTDSLSYKLQSDIVRWLASMGQLVIGTVNREYRLGAQGSGDALTPSNVKLTGQSRKGSADIAPVDLGNAILFVQRTGKATNHGRRIRELTYNYVSDSYDGKELTLLAEHITGSGIVEMALMSSPFQILWCVTADGELVGMTYEKEQEVIGWHKHVTDGLVESVAVIPGDNQDELWMIVKRTINGTTKRYIEVMEDFDWGDDQEDCFFVHCGLSYDSTPATVFSGLEHLEGETVDILADGEIQAQQVVTSGQITLGAAASVVHVGLPYTSYLQPLDLEGGSAEGISQGKPKRIHSVAVNFYETRGNCYIGQDSATLETIDFGDNDHTPPPLYSGIKDDFNFPADWKNEGTVLIKHSGPLPCTVLSIMPRFRTEDK